MTTSKERNVEDVNLLTLLYTAQEEYTGVPPPFEVIEKTEWTDAKGGEEHRRVSAKSKNERFREMLLRARANQVRYRFVVAEAGLRARRT